MEQTTDFDNLPGAICGQRVRVKKWGQWGHKVDYEGAGHILTFLATQTASEGCIDRKVSAIVETDDGRFLDCLLSELTADRYRITEAGIAAIGGGLR